MKEKIMIVDDHEDIREVVHVLLTNEGYQIIEAKDGKEALELLDDEIALIILDVMMPEMNGYQVCLLMREKTNAPILFLTAKGQESDKTLGFSSGGDDYLTKPFSYNELNARVKALLRRYLVYQGKEKEIFRPFETTKENGIGLGLNIVKDIVEKYHGDISVKRSETMLGAKFIVTLPKGDE